MDKRFVLIGVVLMVAGALVAFSYSSQIGTKAGTLTRQSLIVAPNSLVYSPITLNKTNAVYVIYTSGNVPVDFYLVDSYAFSGIVPDLKKGYVPKNIISEYSGNGLYIEIKNSSQGIFPYNSSLSGEGFPAPKYYSGAEVLGSGTYYMIYANPGSLPSNITFGYVLPSAGLTNDTQQFISSGMGLYGSVSAVMVLAGIIMIVWGVISEGKDKEDTEEKEAAIHERYEEIDGVDAKRHRPAKRMPAEKKRRKARRRLTRKSMRSRQGVS